MKKKKVNLRQLALNKSNVASLESGNLTGGTSGFTGGFQSWTGTAEPCFSDFGCGPQTQNCPSAGCPPQTQNCPTNGCPTPTNGCGITVFVCNSDSVCPQGVQCY
ncbi:hypothetical protein [Kordia sp.]|uniref:hypothetical protein n=1 Tax=Kordia sp. TaxID=1965332 RepID=UPI003D2AD447